MTSLGAALAVAHPAYAQPLPLPIGPPLPLPSLPIPAVQTQTQPLSSGSSSSESGEPSAPRAPASSVPSLETSLRASSREEQRALAHSRVHESWYGWQTLAADAASVGVLLLGAAVFTPPRHEPMDRPGALPEPVIAVSGGLYLASAPAVHLGHGNVGRALRSTGLRLVLPAAAFAAGYFANVELGRPLAQAVSDGALSSVFGAAVASAVDAAVFARDSWYGAGPGRAAAVWRVNGSF